MISAHLPAGTKIVCIEDASEAARAYAVGLGGSMPLRGTVYTIRGFAADTPHCVYLAELSFSKWRYLHLQEPGFGREYFRVVQELPASILECLNARPKRVNKRERADA